MSNRQQKKRSLFVVVLVLIVTILFSFVSCASSQDEPLSSNKPKTSDSQPSSSGGISAGNSVYLPLTLSYDQKEVSPGTPLSEALSDLVISERGILLSLDEILLSGEYDPESEGSYTVLLSHGYYRASVTIIVSNSEGAGEGEEHDPPFTPDPQASIRALSLSYDRKEVKKGTPLTIALSDLEVREADRTISLDDVSVAGAYDPSRSGEYLLTLSYEDLEAVVTLCVSAQGVAEGTRYETLNEYLLLNDMRVNVPSVGSTELLVIPIAFSNVEHEGEAELLEKAFNGRSEDTGWESLSSFYEKSSFGKLHLHATILPTYESGMRFRRYPATSPDNTLLKEALAYYDEEYDFSAFDANQDGYIDCVCMIYLADYDTDSDVWWAYEDEAEEEVETADGVRASTYLWMSISFFSDSLDSSEENSDLINAETLIHEMGHVLGLDDYYDYEEEEYGGLGNLNMMDGTWGDHDPFSKAILGWIEPTVVCRSDYESTLLPYEESGEVIFVMKDEGESYFLEYYAICFQTPTGLFALRATEDQGLFTESGVLVYHVTANLKEPWEIENSIEIYETNNGREPRLIRICEADDDDSIDDTWELENEDLFGEGASFTPIWNDGSAADFTMTVIAVSEDGARIAIDFAEDEE